MNYPGVERTSGRALTESMRRQAQNFGAEFLLAEVTELDMSADIKKSKRPAAVSCPVSACCWRLEPIPARWDFRGKRNSAEEGLPTAPPVTENFLPEETSL